MRADNRDHHTLAAFNARFELYARRALRKAIVHCGWNHPAVTLAQRIVYLFHRVGRVLEGRT